MKYLIYTRVSPKGSDWVGDETTVVDQAAQCRAYVLATDPKGEVVDVIQDEFQSGGNSKRPGWVQIISELKTGTAQWDVLCVRHLDRFSRSIADAVTALELIHDSGKHLIATAQGLNSSTPSGRGVINILLSIAQMEREFSSERTRLKMHSIAAKGHWPVGKPPFGYRRGPKHDNVLRIDPVAARVVRSVFKRYAAGDGATELAKDYGMKLNRILHILQNRVYLGLICYDGREYKGAHKALITVKQFNEAKDVRPKTVKAPRPRSQKYPYILSGLVKCSCGLSMTPASSYGRSRKYFYYQCTDKVNCKNRVAAPDIEADVLKVLRNLKLSKAEQAKLKREAAAMSEKGSDLDAELADLESQRDKLQAKVDRITDMFTEGLIDLNNSALMNGKLSAASAELATVTGSLDAVKTIMGEACIDSDLETMICNASALRKILTSDPEPEHLRLIVGDTVREVRCGPDGWRIWLGLPGGASNSKGWLRISDQNAPLLIGKYGVFTVVFG